jgi:hypothetical protein
MTQVEAGFALAGLFMAVFGLCWAIRNWPRDPTDEELWP